jgi:hypothetical protein
MVSKPTALLGHFHSLPTGTSGGKAHPRGRRLQVDWVWPRKGRGENKPYTSRRQLLERKPCWGSQCVANGSIEASTPFNWLDCCRHLAETLGRVTLEQGAENLTALTTTTLLVSTMQCDAGRRGVGVRPQPWILKWHVEANNDERAAIDAVSERSMSVCYFRLSDLLLWRRGVQAEPKPGLWPMADLTRGTRMQPRSLLLASSMPWSRRGNQFKLQPQMSPKLFRARWSLVGLDYPIKSKCLVIGKLFGRPREGREHQILVQYSTVQYIRVGDCFSTLRRKWKWKWVGCSWDGAHHPGKHPLWGEIH